MIDQTMSSTFCSVFLLLSIQITEPGQDTISQYALHCTLIKLSATCQIISHLWGSRGISEISYNMVGPGHHQAIHTSVSPRLLTFSTAVLLMKKFIDPRLSEYLWSQFLFILFGHAYWNDWLLLQFLVCCCEISGDILLRNLFCYCSLHMQVPIIHVEITFWSSWCSHSP